jgi:phosphopantetheinyl transferase (holo-ACP synthase)
VRSLRVPSATPIIFEPFGQESADTALAVGRAVRRLGLRPEEFGLHYTEWGQPRLARRPALEKQAAPTVARHGLPVVSFTHDGTMRIAAVGCASGLIGLGVDVVDRARMERYQREPRLRQRLARRVLGRESEGEPTTDSIALAFCIKEAVSKALGTGLRLGLGMGGNYGARLHDIAVTLTDTTTAVSLSGSARERARALRASSVEVHHLALPTHWLAVALLGR